jgi:hypothetical protein
MNHFLITIPKKEVCDIIFRFRNQIVDAGFAQIDSRINAIPHVTITYIEQELNNHQIDDLISSFNSIVIPTKISLSLLDITNWNEKVVALFNPSVLAGLVNEYKKAFDKLLIKVNKDYESHYGQTIGDHMKIAREIQPDKIETVLKLAKSTIPLQVPLEKIALIGYGCETKDIIWETDLCF